MAKDQYLSGKLAIVTGAGKPTGIGAAAAYALAQHGANVVIHYGKSSVAAAETVKKIEALGVKAVAISADQESDTFGQDLVQATLKAFNTETIDIIVNNAGTGACYPNVESIPLKDFDWMFRTNVRGPLLLVQAAIPYLASPGGRIVNVSSVVARTGCLPMYSATKAALGTFALGWGEELGPKGITVNTVLPGPVETDMVLPDDHPIMQKFRFEQHIKRNGTTTEVAETILFLASPMASYLTCQQVSIDGGMTYR
ncbi:hypothetical protein V8E54_005751 [Elaphomyces granulatus]|jgi:NAD(P)-dependent dehydrogenase (short-subunit alcohol dehydrogenase family)